MNKLTFAIVVGAIFAFVGVTRAASAQTFAPTPMPAWKAVQTLGYLPPPIGAAAPAPGPAIAPAPTVMPPVAPPPGAVAVPSFHRDYLPLHSISVYDGRSSLVDPNAIPQPDPRYMRRGGARCGRGRGHCAPCGPCAPCGGVPYPCGPAPCASCAPAWF